MLKDPIDYAGAVFSRDIHMVPKWIQSTNKLVQE